MDIRDTYNTANDAFYSMYRYINAQGHEAGNGTRSIYNLGVTILKPQLNQITADFRKWNPKYAEREWAWYLSQNRSVEHIKRYAPIWDMMHGGDNIVNSNYGYQWNRNDQLEACIEELKRDENSRRAFITILDSKEYEQHEFDTPCTIGINFRLISGALCMSVLMRSNDLWYGFCNDQYCFSKLQMLVADKLKVETGWYYHYASDMHLYEAHYITNLN